MSALSTFLGDSILKYRKKHIEFIPTNKLNVGAIVCTGEATKEKLRIATGGNQDDWLPVFIHETSHLDQDTESPLWFQECEESGKEFEQWLDGKVEHKHPESIAAKVIALEHDCEQRSLAKITKYKLPVDPIEYAQKANAYLLSYAITIANRQWESTPYNDPAIWKKMPEYLLGLAEVKSPSEFLLKAFRKSTKPSNS